MISSSIEMTTKTPVEAFVDSFNWTIKKPRSHTDYTEALKIWMLLFKTSSLSQSHLIKQCQPFMRDQNTNTYLKDKEEKKSKRTQAISRIHIVLSYSKQPENIEHSIVWREITSRFGNNLKQQKLLISALPITPYLN